jgi:hypothetical protein
MSEHTKNFNHEAVSSGYDLDFVNTGRMNCHVREFYRRFQGGDAQAGMRLLPGMPIVYPQSKHSVMMDYISELTH